MKKKICAYCGASFSGDGDRDGMRLDGSRPCIHDTQEELDLLQKRLNAMRNVMGKYLKGSL